MIWPDCIDDDDVDQVEEDDGTDGGDDNDDKDEQYCSLAVRGVVATTRTPTLMRAANTVY